MDSIVLVVEPVAPHASGSRTNSPREQHQQRMSMSYLFTFHTLWSNRVCAVHLIRVYFDSRTNCLLTAVIAQRYLIFNCDNTTKARILRCTQGQDLKAIRIPLLIDAFIAYVYFYEYLADLQHHRSSLVRYVSVRKTNMLWAYDQSWWRLVGIPKNGYSSIWGLSKHIRKTPSPLARMACSLWGYDGFWGGTGVSAGGLEAVWHRIYLADFRS